jgi:hypothetical protein
MGKDQLDFAWVTCSQLAEAMAVGFRLAADELLQSIPECDFEERLPTLKAVEWFEANADLLSERQLRLESE